MPMAERPMGIPIPRPRARVSFEGACQFCSVTFWNSVDEVGMALAPAAVGEVEEEVAAGVDSDAGVDFMGAAVDSEDDVAVAAAAVSVLDSVGVAVDSVADVADEPSSVLVAIAIVLSLAESVLGLVVASAMGVVAVGIISAVSVGVPDGLVVSGTEAFGSTTWNAELIEVQSAQSFGRSPFCNRNRNGMLKSLPGAELAIHSTVFVSWVAFAKSCIRIPSSLQREQSTHQQGSASRTRHCYPALGRPQHS